MRAEFFTTMPQVPIFSGDLSCNTARPIVSSPEAFFMHDPSFQPSAFSFSRRYGNMTLLTIL